MGVSMMNIWIMRVAVNHPFMTMRMTMWFAHGRELIMLVLMVFVMNMPVIVLDRFMPMLVVVLLSQV